MKLSHLMTLTAVLTGIFGLAFVFVPVQLLSYYGNTAGTPLELIGRFFGSALIGFAVWLGGGETQRIRTPGERWF